MNMTRSRFHDLNDTNLKAFVSGIFLVIVVGYLVGPTINQMIFYEEGGDAHYM